MDKKWICAPYADIEVWEATDYFDTREEAIEAAREGIKDFNADPQNECIEDLLGYYPEDDSKLTEFAVGQAVSYKISIDIDNIIELIQEDAYDKHGEYAENYLDDVKEEHKKELEELILKWFDKHDYNAKFYTIYNVSEIEVD